MKSNVEVAREVIAGIYGNGQDRISNLTQAGYDYNAVQSIVNALLSDSVIEEPSGADNANQPLEIEYDPQKNTGIIVNVLI